MTCPNCGSEWAADVKFCVRDGTPLGNARPSQSDTTPRHCPKCGSQYVGAKFCARDGTPLVPTA